MLDSLKLHSHKEFTELKTDRDNVLAKLQASENEVNNLKAMSVDMTTKQTEHDNVIATLKAEHQTALDTMKADYETQLTNLRSQVETEKQSAETKGQAIAASIGIADETKLPKIVPTVSVTDVVKMLEATTDINERRKIFNQHKPMLAKEAGIDLTRWK